MGSKFASVMQLHQHNCNPDAQVMGRYRAELKALNENLSKRRVEKLVE